MPVSQRQTLREAIRAAGLTQRKLADRIGVTEGVISRHVNGMPVPETRQDEIAQTLGVDASDVIWPRPTEAAA